MRLQSGLSQQYPLLHILLASLLCTLSAEGLLSFQVQDLHHLDSPSRPDHQSKLVWYRIRRNPLHASHHLSERQHDRPMMNRLYLYGQRPPLRDTPFSVRTFGFGLIL